MPYKRNQVEEAIARIFVPNCEKPSSELRTRIKRLLDLDRSIGRNAPKMLENALKGKFICVGASIRLGSREPIGREVAIAEFRHVRST